MRLNFLKDDRFWKWLLWIGIGIFLLTRLLTLASFPVFNDEALYLQYSQLIHEDFGKYKLVSAGLNIYQDWKPPLQYWIGSVFFGLAEDPLLAGRLASLFISLFGLFGVYLLVKELFGRKEAAVAIFLYALFPPALFFNIQFVAETFVFSLAPWMYWCFLKAIRQDKIRLPYALAAAVFGALVLLSKQSGMLYVLFSALLLVPVLDRTEDGEDREGVNQEGRWRSLLARIAVAAGVILVALLLRRLGLSSESARLEGRFNENWLMAPSEILHWPVRIWWNNLMLIRDYYFHYYSVFILPPILYFFFLALRRLEAKSIAVGLGFLGGSAAVAFLLKGFNEYIYNTAVIVFLIPILAASFFSALGAVTEPRSEAGKHGVSRAAGIAVLISFALIIPHWGYQDALMKVSPAGYIRRSTPWANANYLGGWSGGFGVAEAIAHVKGMEPPILVFMDPQWGNPRTAFEVYSEIPPKTMHIIVLTSDFLTEKGAQIAKQHAREVPLNTRLVVFSSATNETRAVWQGNVEKYLCDTRQEIQVEPTQPPIVICSF